MEDKNNEPLEVIAPVLSPEFEPLSGDLLSMFSEVIDECDGSFDSFSDSMYQYALDQDVEITEEELLVAWYIHSNSVMVYGKTVLELYEGEYKSFFNLVIGDVDDPDEELVFATKITNIVDYITL